MKFKFRYLLAALLIIAILGEWRLELFEHDFRFSLSVILFSFFLIWHQDIPPVRFGLIVGVFVLLFRIGLDFVKLSGDFDVLISLKRHFPALVFYVTYAFLFFFLRMKHIRHQAFLLGILLALIEVSSNSIELLTRWWLFGSPKEKIQWNMIVFIAIVRSFSAVGLYYFLLYREARLSKKSLQEKNDQFLSIITGLHNETIQLQISLHDIDQVISYSYELYHDLKNEKHDIPRSKIAQDILWLTCQIHELKKSFHRIHAGLQQVISDQMSKDTMSISEFIQMIVESNQRYANHLNKRIHFHIIVEPEHFQVYPVRILPVFQNPVVNSIEAISSEGQITIQVLKSATQVDIHIIDDGPGISQEMVDAVFKAGFTTKTVPDGKKSTGIGLFYVKEIIRQMGGNIQIMNPPQGAHIHIILPSDKIVVEDSA